MSNWETKNLTGNEDSTNFDTTVNQDSIASTDSLPSNSGHSILGDDAPKWKSGDVILNEFEVIRHLGKGGAGSVYLVKRISIGDLFAAKVPVRSIADSVRLRKLFYREIRTWLGLPVHPHLSACRFIRTIGPKIIVFSEFVDGGSLNEWIVKHKLLNLSDILDVAIQIAWGLHAAHTNKVIHQDIKPSNILVSNDGHVKITDFGLSRAYQAINDEDDTILALRKESIPLTLDQASVSTGIMTPMYCSPEQSDRLPLDYRTDIWSYGLTVLSMFTGPTRWISGVLAESILDGVLKQGPYNPFPTLTNDLVDMLRRCFKKNPQDRWASMKDIADFLITKYMEHTGKDYFRQEPAITVQKGFKSNSPTHPAILKAYEVLGKDLGELEIMEANSVKSRKTWVLHQIELIHELALELRNIETGDKRIQRNLIFDLLIHKIILHREIADFEGAFEILNQLLSFLGHEPFENRSQDDQNQTGRVNYQFGYTHLMRSEFKQAASYFTRAEEIWIPLAEKYDVDGYWDNAINAMNSCAVALHSMKEIQRPLELQNRCIEIFDKLINQKGRKDLRGKAAGNMTNKALLLSEIGKTEEAIELHKKGIAIREMICFDEGQDDLLPSLPTGYINLACDLYALERYQEAIEYNNKAIDLMEDLVFNKGMDDLRLFLARTYMNRGNAESGKNLTDAALSSFDSGIKLIKQMLYNEGNTSLVGELLFVHRNKAHALVDKQHYEEAQTLLKSSLELVIEYYKPSDINKYMVYVTWIFNDLSGIYRKAGNEDKALDCLLQAVVLFKEHSTDAIISAHYIPHLRKTLWNYLNHLSETSGFKEISQEAKHFNDLLSQYEVSVDDADVNELILGIQFYEILAASKLKKDHVTKQTLAHLLETMTEIMKGKPGNALAPLVSKAEDILNTW